MVVGEGVALAVIICNHGNKSAIALIFSFIVCFLNCCSAIRNTQWLSADVTIALLFTGHSHAGLFGTRPHTFDERFTLCYPSSSLWIKKAFALQTEHERACTVGILKWWMMHACMQNSKGNQLRPRTSSPRITLIYRRLWHFPFIVQSRMRKNKNTHWGLAWRNSK